MSFLETALTHSQAHRAGKEPYFFSRFNFDRMKERGNTHFCFHCGGHVGFTPEKIGWLFKRLHIDRPNNHIEDSGYNPMTKHDATHADGVVGNAHKYRYVWDWLAREIGRKKDFPYVVSIPSV